MKIGITGSRGFIGGHCVHRLTSEGHTVVALTSDPDFTELFQYRPGSDERIPLGPDVLKSLDAVLHLAGRPNRDTAGSVTVGWSVYEGANIRLTDRVLSSVVNAGVRTFIFASTTAVYGAQRPVPPTEADLPAPDSMYGISKLTAEHVVRWYGDRFPLSAVSLRLNQVVGPGDGGRGVLPRFCDLLSRGEQIHVHGTGNAVRGFVDVRDVAEAVVCVLRHGRPEPVYNISGRPYSIRALAERCCQEFGLPVPEPTAVTPLNDDASDTSVDCRLAKESLGWEPIHDIAESIRFRRFPESPQSVR